MPRMTEHNYFDVDVRIVSTTIQDTETQESKEGWALIITDRPNLTQHKVAFDQELRDKLLEQLTGGVIPVTAVSAAELAALKASG